MANTRKIVLTSKLRPKNLANPKVAAGFTDAEMGEGKIHWLGTIMGKASGTAKKVDPSDDTKISYALTGFFEGIPGDGARPIVKSGVCYLPGGVHEMIVEQVNSMEDAGGVVAFAFKIGTRRADNQAGYEYVNETLGEASKSDPLDDMRRELASQLAISDQSDTATDEAPAKVKAGGRRR